MAKNSGIAIRAFVCLPQDATSGEPQEIDISEGLDAINEIIGAVQSRAFLDAMGRALSEIGQVIKQELIAVAKSGMDYPDYPPSKWTVQRKDVEGTGPGWLYEGGNLLESAEVKVYTDRKGDAIASIALVPSDNEHIRPEPNYGQRTSNGMSNLEILSILNSPGGVVINMPGDLETRRKIMAYLVLNGLVPEDYGMVERKDEDRAWTIFIPPRPVLPESVLEHISTIASGLLANFVRRRIEIGFQILSTEPWSPGTKERIAAVLSELDAGAGKAKT